MFHFEKVKTVDFIMHSLSIDDEPSMCPIVMNFYDPHSHGNMIQSNNWVEPESLLLM